MIIFRCCVCKKRKKDGKVYKRYSVGYPLGKTERVHDSCLKLVQEFPERFPGDVIRSCSDVAKEIKEYKESRNQQIQNIKNIEWDAE